MISLWPEPRVVHGFGYVMFSNAHLILFIKALTSDSVIACKIHFIKADILLVSNTDFDASWCLLLLRS